MTELRLSEEPDSGITASGHLLRHAPDGKMLYALVTGGEHQPDQLTVIDIPSLQIRAQFSLPTETAYRSVAVGPRSGLLYLFGQRENGVIVTLVDPGNGEVSAEWVAREADGRNWLVYQGEVSPNEDRLYISYHGSDTTGIDWFALTEAGIQRCQSTNPANIGCIGAHGGFVPHDGGLLVATGTNVVRWVAADGAELGAYDTGLTDRHLMEFAVDPEGAHLHAVGTCGYRGGLSMVDLSRPGTLAASDEPGVWTWDRPPASPVVNDAEAPCGIRVSIGSSPFLIVGQTANTVPSLNPGRLLMADSRSAEIVWNIATSAEPVDVLVD